MFERYTERARRVIFFARYEASRMGAGRVETHHLLLALFREDRDLILRCAGARGDLERIRRELEDRYPGEGSRPVSVDLPLSEDSRTVLAYAGEEAEKLGQAGGIGTGHLVLGLLREGKGQAARILREYGVELEQMRREVRQCDAAAPGVGIGAASATSRCYTLAELEQLLEALPEQRREAAGRILEALNSDPVAVAVAAGGTAFSFAYGGSGGGGV
jgi:ATP-dependent Clp protease ATP-binding subunit ClpC